MNTADILKDWNSKTVNKQAAVEWWNTMAGGFSERPLPSFDQDEFLQLLVKEQMLNKDTKVLDVGCGTGGYAMAIASKVSSVTGVDLSPEMIKSARSRAADLNIHNVQFDVIDWHELDAKESGWEKKFDLVIAHMTPAIQGYETFQKLLDCSSGWCVMVKPVQRTDTVYDEILRIVGIDKNTHLGDSDTINAFAYLFVQQCYPRIRYQQKRFQSKQPIEKAISIYTNRIKSIHNLTGEQQTQIEDYLHSVAQDGLVQSVMDTKTATLYWHI